jgi:hypothetical protein
MSIVCQSQSSIGGRSRRNGIGHSLIVEVVPESLVAGSVKEQGRIVKLLIHIESKVLFNLPSPMSCDLTSSSRGVIDLRGIDNTIPGILSVSYPLTNLGRSISGLRSGTFLDGCIEFCRLIQFRPGRFVILFDTRSSESPSVIDRWGVSLLIGLRGFVAYWFGFVVCLMLSGSSRLGYLERSRAGFTDYRKKLISVALGPVNCLCLSDPGITRMSRFDNGDLYVS